MAAAENNAGIKELVHAVPVCVHVATDMLTGLALFDKRAKEKPGHKRDRASERF